MVHRKKNNLIRNFTDNCFPKTDCFKLNQNCLLFRKIIIRLEACSTFLLNYTSIYNQIY